MNQAAWSLCLLCDRDPLPLRAGGGEPGLVCVGQDFKLQEKKNREEDWIPGGVASLLLSGPIPVLSLALTESHRGVALVPIGRVFKGKFEQDWAGRSASNLSFYPHKSRTNGAVVPTLQREKQRLRDVK